MRSRGDALLPLSLATFIFEALVTATPIQGRPPLPCSTHRLPTDETLGFEAAVAALGLKVHFFPVQMNGNERMNELVQKTISLIRNSIPDYRVWVDFKKYIFEFTYHVQANVSEADHPLLCEGTRRQRGDLAVMLLVHYKDDADKLAKIMEKLLDRQVHPLYKAPLLSSFYTNNPTPMGHHHNSQQQHSSRQSQVRQRRQGVGTGIATLALDQPVNNGGNHQVRPIAFHSIAFHEPINEIARTIF